MRRFRFVLPVAVVLVLAAAALLGATQADRQASLTGSSWGLVRRCR